MSLENIDEIIKKYSDDLLRMGKAYGGEAPESYTTPSEKENEESSVVAASNSDEEENTKEPPETAEIQPSEAVVGDESASVDTEPAVKPPAVAFPEGDADSSATFTAVVFSGEGTYPVEGARVVVYRGDKIYAFLVTDNNGTTKKVKLPAFAKENSLEEENPEQSIEYFADVFAEGFISQKSLLVSSVGGSDILLRVLMVPEGEKVD